MQRGGNYKFPEMRSERRLARCSWAAEFQGVRVRLAPGYRAGRPGFDTPRLRTFDFPPEGPPSCRPGQAEPLGNLPPIKSSVTPRHGSTLIRKIPASLLHTPVDERRKTNFHRIPSNPWDDRTLQTKMSCAGESDGHDVGLYIFLVGTCGRRWLA